MKLSLALSAVVAVSAKKGNKDKKVQEVRTNPETCQAQFARTNGEYGSVLDVKITGTSGWIDMHNYPNSANCYIFVNADLSCTQVTTKVIHAGIETNNYDGCDSDYDDGYYGGCCQYDRFWWNEEQERSCGCRGTNLPQGDGCNDVLAAYPTSNAFNYGLADYPEKGFEDRTFIGNTFKFNFATDFRDAQGNLRIEWACSNPAPSAPSDPIERLMQVLSFSKDVLDEHYHEHRHYLNWIQKFNRNTMRMKASYYKCGNDPVIDPVAEWVTYDNSSPSKAMEDVTVGFTKWAKTYLNSCKGQYNRNHIAHIRRMDKWNRAIKNHDSVSHLN
jgi:hypothetical protein